MAESYLHELFDRPRADSRLTWFCEPANWAVDAAARCLNIRPEGETDFWQRTHYGFRADNGHFLFAPVAGDFVATTHVRFSPAHQYDQAGLMVRLSPTCWLKTSVEYQAEGPSRLGAVVTNCGYSDWSTQDFPGDRRDVWLRIRREVSDYIVEASDQGRTWSQLRLARLHEDQGTAAVSCGLYACSPKAAGFLAQFSFLKIDLGRVSESSNL
jgi:hypothetical protein